MEKFGELHDKKRIELNNISLKGYENVNVGDVLYYSILSSFGIWQGLKHIICLFFKEVCKITYNIEKKGDGKTLCLFSSSYRDRKDQHDAFMNATRIIEDQVSVRAEIPKWYFGGIRYLKMLPGWNRGLKKVEPEFGARMFYLRTLYRVYVDYNYIQKKLDSMCVKPNYLLSYCDVMPVDSFFVQKYQDRGCKTITLQHGMFGLTSIPWQLRGAKSDYFLAMCRQNAEDLENIGFLGKVIVVGNPHQFDRPEIICSGSYHTNVVGLFMNNDYDDEMEQQNREMLLTVQEYCRSYGRKLMIKYHPANNLESYERLLDKNVVGGIFHNDINVACFLEKIDVAVSGYSTTFLSALASDKPSLIFCKDGKTCLYRNTEVVRFCSVEELHIIMDRIEKDYLNVMRELNSYFNVKGKISDNYKKAYQLIGVMQ